MRKKRKKLFKEQLIPASILRSEKKQEQLIPINIPLNIKVRKWQTKEQNN